MHRRMCLLDEPKSGTILGALFLSTSLKGWFGAENYDELRRGHKGWIEENLGNGTSGRQDKWTGSVAVGSKSFIEKVKDLLGVRAMGRKIHKGGEGYHLREETGPYKSILKAGKDDIASKNTYFWDVSTE